MSNTLLIGPPRYVARSPWRPLLALAVVVLIQAGLQFLAGLLGTWSTATFLGVPLEALTEQQVLYGVLVFLLLSQVAVIALTWFVAGFFGGNRPEVLQIGGEAPSVTDVVVALAGLIVVLGTFNALVYFFLPSHFMADMAQFLPMLREPYWPFTALAIGIGAPISEELLFRGFLVSALTQWRFGFWPAALLVNTLWTLFHLGYSAVGLLEVFVGGVYITWLLWRTGSIWLPIICHAATNIVFLLIIAIYTFP